MTTAGRVAADVDNKREVGEGFSPTQHNKQATTTQLFRQVARYATMPQSATSATAALSAQQKRSWEMEQQTRNGTSPAIDIWIVQKEIGSITTSIQKDLDTSTEPHKTVLNHLVTKLNKKEKTIRKLHSEFIDARDGFNKSKAELEEELKDLERIIGKRRAGGSKPEDFVGPKPAKMQKLREKPDLIKKQKEALRDHDGTFDLRPEIVLKLKDVCGIRTGNEDGSVNHNHMNSVMTHLNLAKHAVTFYKAICYVLYNELSAENKTARAWRHIAKKTQFMALPVFCTQYCN